MKTQRLPEQEYVKLYKLVRKYEARFDVWFTKGCHLNAARCLKKVRQLINRMRVLEFIMMVPEERRFTNGYSEI